MKLKRFALHFFSVIFLASCSIAPLTLQSASSTPTEILATVTKTRTPKPTVTKTPERTKTPTATATQDAMGWEIVSKLDLENLDKLPLISEQEAQSDELTAFVMSVFDKGLVGEFPANSEPFGVLPTSKVTVDYSENQVDSTWVIPTELRRTGRYTDPSIRPYLTPNCYFRTTIGAEDYVLFFQIWENPDGNQVLFKYVVSFDLVNQLYRYLGINEPNPSWMVFPTYFPPNKGEWVSGNNIDMYYYENYWLGIQIKIKALTEQVENNGGNVPPEAANFLLSPFPSFMGGSQ